jgi:hypothetical protein
MASFFAALGRLGKSAAGLAGNVAGGAKSGGKLGKLALTAAVAYGAVSLVGKVKEYFDNRRAAKYYQQEAAYNAQVPETFPGQPPQGYGQELPYQQMPVYYPQQPVPMQGGGQLHQFTEPAAGRPSFVEQYGGGRASGTPANWGAAVGGSRAQQGNYADNAREPVGAGPRR